MPLFSTWAYPLLASSFEKTFHLTIRLVSCPPLEEGVPLIAHFHWGALAQHIYKPYHIFGYYHHPGTPKSWFINLTSIDSSSSSTCGRMRRGTQQGVYNACGRTNIIVMLTHSHSGLYAIKNATEFSKPTSQMTLFYDSRGGCTWLKGKVCSIHLQE